MSLPRVGDSKKWSATENQSKPLASANFHSLRISPSGPPMCPMWIPNFMPSPFAGGSGSHPVAPVRLVPGHEHTADLVVEWLGVCQPDARHAPGQAGGAPRDTPTDS